MNARVVWTILRKEIIETLRDKRALFAMIGVPVLLYPLLIIVTTQVMTVQAGKLKRTPSRVVITGDVPADVAAYLRKQEMIDLAPAKLGDPEQRLRDGEIGAIVSLSPKAPAETTTAPASASSSAPASGPGSAPAPAGAPTTAPSAAETTIRLRIQYDSTELESTQARGRVQQAVRAHAKAVLSGRLKEAGLTEAFVEPIAVDTADVAPPTKRTGSILGKILPLVLIMMLGVGAFYPAVDVTAGEKERGTFETLLSTPTTKLEIVAGKFLTVFLLAMVTATLNLASMVGSILFQLTQLSAQVPDKTRHFDISMLQLSAGNVAMVFVVLLPLALFVCSAMMSIALLARSFREAQNYVTPFFIFIMLPGMVAAMPGMELTRTTMFLPIANVALLLKDLLIDRATPDLVFGVFLSTAAYALVGLVVAVWLFQREDVILSQEKGLPVTFRRSRFQPRRTPTLGLSLMLFALTLLLLFYVGTWVQGRDVISGLLITEWLLLLLPVVGLLWFVRIDVRSSLSLYAPRPAAAGGALLAGLGAFALVMQLQIWQQHVLPTPPGLQEQMQGLFATDGSWARLALLLATVALSPAICEEVLFRGAILSGLRTRMSPVVSVVVVGLLFGLFHLSIYRLLATSLLGMLITYLVLRSGSLVPGMIAHLVNNGLAVLLATGSLPKEILQWVDEETLQAEGLPAWLLGASAALLVSGIVLVEALGRRTQPDASAQTN